MAACVCSEEKLQVTGLSAALPSSDLFSLLFLLFSLFLLLSSLSLLSPVPLTAVHTQCSSIKDEVSKRKGDVHVKEYMSYVL